MKGVSGIVIVILLVLISISLVGALYIWVTNTTFDIYPEEDIQQKYQRGRACLNIDDIDGVELAQAILSGKHGFMCQYDPSLNFETIWSSVFDINGKRIFRAEGDPSRVKYKEDARTSQL